MRYAIDHGHTPNNKAAEWCAAVARDAEKLLAELGINESSFPTPRMPLEPRVALTNVGTDELSSAQYQVMQLGADAWRVLGRIPAALWFLQRAASFSAHEYEKRARFRNRSDNIAQSQNTFLVEIAACFLDSRFGIAPPGAFPRMMALTLVLVSF